jgi:hypothetical protein
VLVVARAVATEQTVTQRAQDSASAVGDGYVAQPVRRQYVDFSVYLLYEYKGTNTDT